MPARLALCTRKFIRHRLWTRKLNLSVEVSDKRCLASPMASLVPRRGGGGERAPGTHCLRMRLIATEFHGDCVRTCMYIYSWCHKLAALLWQFMCSWCSVRVSFISRCSMPSGSWIPRDKAQERTGCLQWVRLPRKHAFMRLSTHFGKSIPTTASQTFLFIPDSITLGRVCSSDVYSVLRTRIERFFLITIYAIHVNRRSSY